MSEHTYRWICVLCFVLTALLALGMHAEQLKQTRIMHAAYVESQLCSCQEIPR